ncbi:Uncharacterised protein [Mycobacterium tuberculosis]|nr:Uncharacterised protein [Mycobacterium tuberculosis]
MVAKRARSEVASRVIRSGVRPAALSASSTRVWVEASTLTTVLAADTCTAGASPKKLGRA